MRLKQKSSAFMNQKRYIVVFGQCVTVFDVWPEHFLPVNQRNSGVQAKVVISKSTSTWPREEWNICSYRVLFVCFLNTD